MKLKGISICYSALKSALCGNYVSFGVFKLYGDDHFDKVLQAFVKTLLSVSHSDLLVSTRASWETVGHVGPRHRRLRAARTRPGSSRRTRTLSVLGRRLASAVVAVFTSLSAHLLIHWPSRGLQSKCDEQRQLLASSRPQDSDEACVSRSSKGSAGCGVPSFLPPCSVCFPAAWPPFPWTFWCADRMLTGRRAPEPGLPSATHESLT